MNGRDQYGIVGCCFAEDYNNNRIKKHEFTRKDKEADRIKHVDITNINAGPIFLTYKAKDSINNMVSEIVKQKPIYDFTAEDGIGHTVWMVNDEKIADQMIEEFSKIENLYIADGHHRAASAAAVANKRKEANPAHQGTEEYNFFLSVLFPDNHLQIMDYNRVLKSLNNQSEAELFGFLEDNFTCEKVGSNEYKPTKKGEIGMYMNKEWYKVTIKPENVDYNDPVNSLDVAVLQSRVLAPFFGIADPRTSKDVDFIGGIRGLKELVKLVDCGKFKVAFAMYPTSIKELMDIADAGEVMPPKSTWFEPKLRSGLLVHSLS